MNCNGFQKLLPLEIEDHLKGDLKNSFHCHRTSCIACNETYEELKAAEQYLSSLTMQDIPLADDFEEKIMDKIQPIPVRTFSQAAHAFSGICFLGFVLSIIVFPSMHPLELVVSYFKTASAIIIGLISYYNLPAILPILIVYGIILWSVLIFSGYWYLFPIKRRNIASSGR
jgi:hypothetical protein